MRKLIFAFFMLVISHVSFGQAVNESAIIPVSVTLNSILRLNVESGGNIKFVFSSMTDYNTGFTGTTGSLYATVFSVASSRNFTVSIYADAANFQPSDNAANTNLLIGNLEYDLNFTGAGTTPTIAAGFAQMTDASVDLFTDGTAGDGTDNRFELLWRLGAVGNTLGTILSQSIEADHYITNVFLEVTPNP